ncbi:MAG: tetratricopeptide repeat protein [Candidatus Cloacimonetes bacterium]|nr:tetratricopeptide repeat protein [Candidatus Cloacimonadota bacterium]
MNKKNDKIPTESVIITVFLFFIICIILCIIFLGGTKSGLLAGRTEAGRVSEANSYFDFATQFIKVKRFPEAISNFKKAIKMDPDFCEAYTNLAVAYAKTGENQKAVRVLKKALTKDPDEDYLIYLNLAQVYRRFDNEKAEQAYKIAIELHPFPKYAYFNLGDFYWKLENYDKATESFKKGLVLHNLKSYYIGSIKRGIKIYSESPELVRFLKKLKEAGATDEVMQKYDKIVFNNYYLKNNKKIAEKYDQVGYYYLQKGKSNKASDYFEKSIQFWNSKRNRAYEHLKRVDNTSNL